MKYSHSFWDWIISIVSLIVIEAVLFLILGPQSEGSTGGWDVSMLPTVNAVLIGLSAILLLY